MFEDSILAWRAEVKHLFAQKNGIKSDANTTKNASLQSKDPITAHNSHQAGRPRMSAMKQGSIRLAAIAVTIMGWALAGSAPGMADELPSTPAMRFETITALVGEWQVQEHASLRIVFEPTAGGSVIIERWMVGERKHSLTIYHLDGERLIATHYCPQGNQPRLAATTSDTSKIRFSFLDATGLDPAESYQHDLSLERNADGTVARAET